MTNTLTIEQVVEAFSRFSHDEQTAVFNSIRCMIPDDAWLDRRTVQDDPTGIDPVETYEAIDRSFAEGWNHPSMCDYDNYPETK